MGGDSPTREERTWDDGSKIKDDLKRDDLKRDDLKRDDLKIEMTIIIKTHGCGLAHSCGENMMMGLKI